MVPSSAASGSEAMYSGITALFQPACSSPARLAALARSVRDRPAPFSIESSGAAMPFTFSQWRRTSRAWCTCAGGSYAALARVRKSCLAITLLENLLTSRTISASGADSCVCSSCAPSGTMPSRARPLQAPPISVHSSRSTPPTCSSGGRKATFRSFSPQAIG